MNGDLTIPTLLQGRIALVPTPYSAPLNAIAYEVIRVERGCPLFLQEHLGRLSQSLAVTGQRLPDGNGWVNGVFEMFCHQPVPPELYFCEAYWPDFRRTDFLRALRDYTQRERRLGR